MKYKVGNRVKIKNLDWYNENKNEFGDVPCEGYNFVESMSTFCGKILTIDINFRDGTYIMKEDDEGYTFTNEMIEGLVEEEIITANGIQLNQSNTSLEKEMEWNLPEGYQFKDENGNVINATKIVLEKIKKEYPKTYKECCEVLGLNDDITNSELLFYYKFKSGDYTTIRLPEMEKFEKFIQLYLCRNAYWKMAGEEMGLGKPWVPDYKNPDIDLYVIINIYNRVEKAKYGYGFQHCVFTFPTPEMRDAFYENFKTEIEECKELL